MRQLRDLWFIQTKPGATGGFHYVLLLNTNAAVELIRSQGKVEDLFYGVLVDCLVKVSAMERSKL